MKVATKQELRDHIEYLESELRKVTDELADAEQRYMEACVERDNAVESLMQEKHGDRGSD